MYLDMAEAVVMTVDTLGSPHSTSEGKASAAAVVAGAEGMASAEIEQSQRT